MCTFLMQDNVNIYRSSPPLPGITRPTHLLPSGHNPLKRRQPWADESVDSIVPESDVKETLVPEEAVLMLVVIQR